MKQCIVCLFLLALPVSAQVSLEQRGQVLHFGNERVELQLVAGSGYFLQIRNKQTGIQHKPPGDGVWPFGVWVGTREKPDQMKAEIRSDGVQKMEHRMEKRGEASVLLLTYRVLVDNETRRETGVGLGVEIELAPERGYFIVRTEIANGGPLWVTNFYAARGIVRTGDASREQEFISIPTRGRFARSRFSGMSLGLPTYGWGWSDYSGQRGGIGMAYVSRDGIQMVFDMRPLADGVEQSWRLFDTRGYWHFEASMNDFQKSLRIQPLEPANNYVTGEWLIVPHAGDWHQTADAYRERYLQAFPDDHLTWDALPGRAKNLYVRFGLWVAENWIGNAYPRKVLNPLPAVVPQVKNAIETLGMDPSRAGVLLTWFQPHVGRYPEFYPVWQELGGDEAMKRTTASLRQMGLSFVMGYTHFGYTHPAAKNHVLEADTLGTVPAVNPVLGNRACVDNSAWARLWEKEVIPAYAALGFDAVYADEGHFPWGTCAVAGPAHLHGNSAVGILTANSRGVLRLHRLLHQGLGANSLVEVEGSGEIAGRWADLNMAYEPAMAFTLPFKRLVWYVDALQPDSKRSEKINTALDHGYALSINLSDGKPILDLAAFRRYISLRRRLDEEHAPGYPQGFRDTVGVTSGNPALVARSFRDPKGGITIVYYANEAVNSEVEVNGAELGFPQLGVKKRQVKLSKNDADFWVLRP